MQYLGVNYQIKHIPALDPEFIPFGIWADAYRKEAKMELVFSSSIFYNIIIMNILGVECHAGSRQAEYGTLSAESLSGFL